MLLTGEVEADRACQLPPLTGGSAGFPLYLGFQFTLSYADFQGEG